MPSALAVQSTVSVKAAIYFAIEFTWHVPCLLILILSTLSGSHRGRSVCLTNVKSSLLSFCLSRDQRYHFNWYLAGVLIHKYEQTSGCMCPHFRVVSCWADLNAPSLTLRESVSRVDLKIKEMRIMKEFRYGRYLYIQCTSFACISQFYV